MIKPETMRNVRQLKSKYQNGRDNIGRDLILPCIESCNLYRRGTGFFSSSSLKSYAQVMGRVINDRVKFEILCSPIIQDKSLVTTLTRNITKEQRRITLSKISDNIVLAAIGFKLNSDHRGYRSKLLAYMIASEQLEVRFAIPLNFNIPLEEELNENNIYHVKLGYFDFPDGSRVAFDGSFNESDSGHQYHIDRTQVYRSWIESDVERLNDVASDIDTDWEGLNQYISVRKLSKETLAIVKRCSPSKRPKHNGHPGTNHREKPSRSVIPFPDGIWPHKKLAVETFLHHKKGVLEMATGTGKTSTALEIARQLYLSGKIETIIISTYLTDLLSQWCEEIQDWQLKQPQQELDELIVFKQFEAHSQLQAFLNSPSNSILVVSRDARKLKRVLEGKNINRDRTIIIHDEIHGFGSNSMVTTLTGSHSGIAYRLGLSATPEREYDEIGTKFIEGEVGPTIFEFPVEEAIKKGILCEFDYEPLEFELTGEDKKNRKNVYARKAAAKKQGTPWTKERLYIELSKVVKKAELKPLILAGFLRKNPESLKSSIVFVLDEDHGNTICDVIRKFTYKYKTYYSGTDGRYLDLLAKGKIDCLVACERLNEGIDIRSLKSVFLVSSDKARLKTIQRIGRCLRRDPNDSEKVALVVDFILDEGEKVDDTADKSRMKWLQSVSNTRRIND